MNVYQYFGWVICCLSSVLLPTAAQAETLVLGSVSDDIRTQMERFAPLTDYLEDVLADDGIVHVDVAVLPDAQSMARALRNGEVDLYFDGTLIAAHVARLAGAEPFLRQWKDGTADYHSILIVPTDSPYQRIDDLRGATLGFQEPQSTSGFMLPAAMLKSAGLHLRSLADYEEPVSHDEVGYVFTGDDRNSMIWLARERIDAAATDPHGFAWLEEAEPDAFRILARSIDVPREVVVRRGDLDPELTDRLSFVLRDMINTAAGLDAMDAFNDTACFDLFPDGVEVTFRPIYQRLDLLLTLGVM